MLPPTAGPLPVSAGERSSRDNWTASERAWGRARRAEARARRRRRSVSFERNVETLIVADPDVVQFYAADNLEAYLLTVMNGVSRLGNDLPCKMLVSFQYTECIWC